MAQEEGSEVAAPVRARRNRLEKATNIAILVTLVLLLLNPSGLGGALVRSSGRRSAGATGGWEPLE